MWTRQGTKRLLIVAQVFIASCTMFPVSGGPEAQSVPGTTCPTIPPFGSSFAKNATVSVYIDTSANGINAADEPQIETILRNWNGFQGVTLIPIKSPNGLPANLTGTQTSPVWLISSTTNVPFGFDAITRACSHYELGFC